MKTNWMLIGIIATGLGLAALANSQETPPAKVAEADKHEAHDPAPSATRAPSDKLVQVQVEYVEMSHEALTKLLFLAKPTSTDAAKLRQTVQEMVMRNEAKVLETQMVITQSGNKATSESIHEFIYPTEYEPPAIPCDISGNKSKEEGPSPPPIPTAFDTRNLGATLEVEPNIAANGRIINLRLVPELVWHTGNTVWHDGKDGFGNPAKIQMPDMSVVRLNTSLTCIGGKYSLAGVLSPKDDKGEVDMTRKLMVFVKCDVLSAE